MKITIDSCRNFNSTRHEKIGNGYGFEVNNFSVNSFAAYVLYVPKIMATMSLVFVEKVKQMYKLIWNEKNRLIDIFQFHDDCIHNGVYVGSFLLKWISYVMLTYDRIHREMIVEL